MAGYNEIRGLRVKYLSTNPSNPEEGEVWYNSTLGQLKANVLGAAVWTSGGSLNTKRSVTVAGTVSAGLASFGYIYPPSSPEGGSNVTEEYNGTAWTTVNTANTPRYQVNSTGTQTAAVAFGGFAGAGSTPGGGPYTATNAFESYNGTTWTNLTGAPTAKAADPPLTGTQTALVQTGGITDTSGTPSNQTQEYNGSWSAGENYPASAQSVSAAGTLTAAVFCGGATNAPGSSKLDTAFEYDGTDFSATGSLPVAATSLGGRTGTQTASIFAGGSSPLNNTTLEYNGSVFAVNPASPSGGRPAIGQGKMSGTAATAALVAGAGSTPTMTTTEEFTGAVVEVKTLTTG